MNKPIERLASLIQPDRLQRLGASIGFSALSGVAYGIELGLMEKYTSFGIIASATTLPLATFSVSLGIIYYDKFLNPEDVHKSDETIRRS